VSALGDGQVGSPGTGPSSPGRYRRVRRRFLVVTPVLPSRGGECLQYGRRGPVWEAGERRVAPGRVGVGTVVVVVPLAWAVVHVFGLAAGILEHDDRWTSVVAVPSRG